MRRKLNENVSDKLYLDVTVMAQNDPDLDFNNLRDTLVANGAIVNGKETDDNHVIMVVEELPKEQVEEVLQLWKQLQLRLVIHSWRFQLQGSFRFEVQHRLIGRSQCEVSPDDRCLFHNHQFHHC